MAECQRGLKVASRLLLHPPLPPVDSSRWGTDGNAKFGKLKVRPRFRARRLPAGAPSVVVYIPNGSKWNHRNFVGIFEKNHQVGYRSLAESPAVMYIRSNLWEFCSSICSSIWSRIRATFGAALALCEIRVSGNAHSQQFCSFSIIFVSPAPVWT